jgi:RHS repeat-associated protein
MRCTTGPSIFGYDSMRRLTNLQHLDGSGANIANYVNTYDLASRITSETLNGGAPTNYSYDSTNELTNDSQLAYTYDLNGNRTMPGYATGPANELTSDGIWNYSHDKNGNLIGKTNISTGETWSYGYDNRNRLISAQQTTGTGVQMQAAYVYDALGQRIEKDVALLGVMTTTRFAYDSREIWADLTAANGLQTRYVHGGRQLELLARVSGGTAAWVLGDRMGSVRYVADAAGTILDAITYDGYGNVTNETSAANGGQYKYAGYRLDSEVGWYRPDPTTGRYYNPATGNWNGRDPIGLIGGGANPYWYVGNSPTNGTDPRGLVKEPVGPEQYKKCWAHIRDTILKKALGRVEEGGEEAIAIFEAIGCFNADSKPEVIKNCMTLLCSIFPVPPCAALTAGAFLEACLAVTVDQVVKTFLPNAGKELVEGWGGVDCKFVVYLQTCVKCCRAHALANPCTDDGTCVAKSGCANKPSVLNK